MTSPDQPFQPRGGDTYSAAIHNRIAIIERIKHLSGVDLRQKSSIYLRALDLEMYKRWYKDEDPKKRADETFCQRAAEVVLAMEGKPIVLLKGEYESYKGVHDARTNAQGGHPDAGGSKENDESRVREGNIDGNRSGIGKESPVDNHPKSDS